MVTWGYGMNGFGFSGRTGAINVSSTQSGYPHLSIDDFESKPRVCGVLESFIHYFSWNHKPGILIIVALVGNMYRFPVYSAHSSESSEFHLTCKKIRRSIFISSTQLSH